MSRVSRAFRIVGTVIKLLFAVGVAFVCGLLLWRVFVAPSIPDEVKGLEINDALYSAYEEKGEDLEIFTTHITTMTSADRNRGYFSAPDFYFLPDANQIQVLFRYNNSTIRALKKDYHLSDEELPDRTERIYDVTLVLNLDLTPENKVDNDKNDPNSVRQIRIHATTEELAQKSLYNYSRLVFDLPEGEPDLATLLEQDLLLAVFADVYYVHDLDYEKDAYGSMCLYDYLIDRVDIKLSKADRKALAAFGEKN